MSPELIELQKKTKDKKYLIDFSNAEDIENMGKQMLETEFDHSYGKVLPTFYYDNGIKEFDSILNGAKDFEYGLYFAMVCFLNSLVFVLYHPTKGIVRIGIWRHRITRYETIEGQQVEILKENRVTNMIKSGLFGEGVAGVTTSIAIGSLIQKVQGIQTTITEGVRYKLFYLDENDNEVCVNIHCPKKYAPATSMFIMVAFPESERNTDLNISKKNCYIATACYGDIDCEEVNMFRWYRDNILVKNSIGKIFIYFYYAISPYFVKCIGSNVSIKKNIKYFLLDNILRFIKSKIKKCNAKI